MAKVAEFVASTAPKHERPKAQLIAGMLKGANDDHLVLRAQAVENGMQYRIEIEPSVLKVLLMMPYMP
jgi:hypothetical protein